MRGVAGAASPSAATHTTAQSGMPPRARNGRESPAHRTSVAGAGDARTISTRRDVLPEATGPVMR